MRDVKLFLLVCVVLFWSEGVLARPVMADLSLRQIEIDSGFKGTEILLFGARNDAGDVVVVIRGPEMSHVMRKKERLAGVWVNRKEAVLNSVDGFYAVASSRPITEIKNDYLIASLGIGLENFAVSVDTLYEEDVAEFRDAFLEQRQEELLYLPSIGDVSFIGDTLFRTIVKFPENIPRGVYTAEIYLFSDGQLIGVQTTPLLVSKIGFAAYVYDFSYRNPAAYGFIAVFIALVAGWLAGVVFRKV